MSDSGRCITNNERNWIFYDIGNSGYVLVYLTFLFPILVKDVFQQNGSFVWGMTIGLSSLTGILCAFYLGKKFDKVGTWPILPYAMFSAISAVLSFLLLYKSKGLALLIFGLSNAAFITTLPRYDSMLVSITDSTERRTKLSMLGWGAGYLGGVFTMLLSYSITGQLPKTYIQYFIYFAIASAVFLLLSIPMHNLSRVLSNGSVSYSGSYPKSSVRHCLLALFMANEGISVIVYFAAIFAKKELHLSLENIALLLLSTQLLAFPLTILNGYVAKKIGFVATVTLNMIIWVVITILLILSKNLNDLMVVMLLTSFVIGSTHAILRGRLADIVPKYKTGHYFSYYALVCKVGAMVGPVIYGLLTLITSHRLALISVIPFFLATVYFTFKIQTPDLANP